MNSPVSMFLQKYNRFAESKAERSACGAEPHALDVIKNLSKAEILAKFKGYRLNLRNLYTEEHFAFKS